jgi:hypothetical protein
MSDLDRLVGELEQAAAQLRTGELEREDAAKLVEQCAELAARLGSELDREAREAAARGERPGQETLL